MVESDDTVSCRRNGSPLNLIRKVLAVIIAILPEVLLSLSEVNLTIVTGVEGNSIPAFDWREGVRKTNKNSVGIAGPLFDPEVRL
jgi:hypothetical protein